MGLINKLAISSIAVFMIATVSACSPEVGSDAWCSSMQDKPKGEWSANEAGDFAKHCLLN